jgi:hypothetical protein
MKKEKIYTAFLLLIIFLSIFSIIISSNINSEETSENLISGEDTFQSGKINLVILDTADNTGSNK